MISGFTLTNGSAYPGGGAYGGTLTNCIITGNSGSGAESSTLYNCTLTGNRVLSNMFGSGGGGGARFSTLYNCTVAGNLAPEGGGAVYSTLYNCTVTGNDGGGIGGLYGESTVYNSIVYYNYGGNYAEGTTLNYCCTTPLPTKGVGNITGPPLFMDMAAGDFRLREESPCIDAGMNLTVLNVGYTYEPTDFLGNTRFIDGNFDGTVAWDIGAYEFNSYKPPRFTCPPQLTSDGWELSVTGAANQWVRLQRSSDLKNWEDVAWWFGLGNAVFMGAEGVGQLYDRQSYEEGQNVMFYRAVVE